MKLKLISLIIASISSINILANNDLLVNFQNPPKAARPQVWWHWMDGEVSLDGVRKDLLWLHNSGIAGVHQFDAGGVNMPRTGVQNRPYLSEPWKEAFRYALHLADSLGMDFTVASAPGWSSTGGPWVDREDAMKKLEWVSVDVNGGKIHTKLPALKKITGTYLDIEQKNDRVKIEPYGYDVAVIAVKRPEKDFSMEEMGAELSKNENFIQIKLKQDYTIKGYTLKISKTGYRSRSGKPSYIGNIEAGEDGIKWREVCKITASNLNYLSYDMPPTTARFFRINVDGLADAVLHSVTKVNHSQEQAGFCTQWDMDRYKTPASEDGIPLKDIVDLSAKMKPDGTLKCRLPRGRWRIYRFGASLTGKVNHPASPNATGLEVDKLDPQAWERYFRNYIELYREAAGGMLGKRGIRNMLVDSYEAGSATWTRNMAEEFEARRGYPLLPWLPALTGELIVGSEETDAFLWDWRKTLGELFNENYARIGNIIREYGMACTYIESHEGGRVFVGDGMDTKINAGVPMSAIWVTDTPNGSPIPSAISDIKESASVAHIFGQNIVAGESFTCDGSEKHAYTYCPENLKITADIAMLAGLNRFVIHESASQPSDSYLPGLGLFKYGQWFHRNETWALYAKYWTDYLARSSYLLQEGQAVADILVYYGEDTNATAQYAGESFSMLPQIPDGYNYDYANPNVLLQAVTPEEGKLKTSTGMCYSVLMLGGQNHSISLKMLRRLREIADAGIVICGPAPLRTSDMNASKAEFEELVFSIWKSGRINVVNDINEAVKLACPQADCICPQALDKGSHGLNSKNREMTPTGLGFVHRRNSRSDIYWLRNFTGSELSAEVKFRSTGKYAYLLNPENGSGAEIEIKNGSAKLLLSPSDAVFVILTDSKIDNLKPLIKYNKNVSQKLLGHWKVDFKQIGSVEISKTFDTLHSWTEEPEQEVKYYSGTVVYSIDFEVSKTVLGLSQEFRLNLGQVRNLAEIFINGKAAGVLWKAPFTSSDIKPLLVAGKNRLEVRVTNLWVNRMIGDRQPGIERPITSVHRFYTAHDPLLPSGLLGPVRLEGMIY